MLPISPSATRAVGRPSPVSPPPPRGWRSALDDIAFLILVMGLLGAVSGLLLLLFG